MIKSGQSLILWIAAPIILALATTGCATKSYVRSHGAGEQIGSDTQNGH